MQEKRQTIFPEDILGGYIITIQKYAKKGEFKYNIYCTRTNELIRTNNTKEFVRYLEDILGQIG